LARSPISAWRISLMLLQKNPGTESARAEIIKLNFARNYIKRGWLRPFHNR
jgi:DNA topoisomerase IA